MADAPNLPARLARIAELQSLRTMASKTELADSQRRRDEARGMLEECEQALAERASAVESCFAEERLDLTALGIGREMLAALTHERDRAQGEFVECETREGESRAEWLREAKLTERAEGLLRKATRHAAQKREDAAVTEMTNLRFVRALRARA
jgi:hypothetical protein